MKPSQLRSWIKKYGNTGLMAVACCLGIRHLWRNHRVALISSISLTLLLVTTFWPRHVTRKPAAPLPRPAVVLLPAPKKEPDFQPRIPLLPLSRRVTRADFSEFLWLSPERLLLVTELLPRKNTTKKGDIDTEAYTRWRGQADLVDIPSGKRTRLKGLSRLFERMRATPWDFELAPGGRWLKWVNRITPDGWPFPVVARLNGTGYQQLSQDKCNATYWLNSHLWVAEETHDHGYDDPMRLFVYDVDKPGRKFSLPKASRRAKRLLSRYAHHINTKYLDAEWEATSKPRVKFFTWEEEDKKKYVNSLLLPMGAEVKEVIFSKDEKQALYLLRFPDSPGFHKCDLWASDVDGNDLREIGFLRCRDDKPPNEDGEVETSDLHSLTWLPDNKQVSFEYQGALYTVPVAPDVRLSLSPGEEDFLKVLRAEADGRALWKDVSTHGAVYEVPETDMVYYFREKDGQVVARSYRGEVRWHQTVADAPSPMIQCAGGDVVFVETGGPTHPAILEIDTWEAKDSVGGGKEGVIGSCNVQAFDSRYGSVSWERSEADVGQPVWTKGNVFLSMRLDVSHRAIQQVKERHTALPVWAELRRVADASVIWKRRLTGYPPDLSHVVANGKRQVRFEFADTSVPRNDFPFIRKSGPLSFVVPMDARSIRFAGRKPVVMRLANSGVNKKEKL